MLVHWYPPAAALLAFASLRAPDANLGQRMVAIRRASIEGFPRCSNRGTEPGTPWTSRPKWNTPRYRLTDLRRLRRAWGVKYDRAVECLIKDRKALLAFYDFPAEHWKHLRTTNVIESAFATIRHRTVRSKECLSNKTALAMIYKLAEAAEKSWRRLDGPNQLPKVILGMRFADGIEIKSQAQAAAFVMRVSLRHGMRTIRLEWHRVAGSRQRCDPRLVDGRRASFSAISCSEAFSTLSKS
jgi:hypothetical protein